MKILNLQYLAMGILFLSACTDSGTLSEEEVITITNEIQEKLNGYPDALQSKDISWFHNFWADEEDFVMALDGNISSDYEIAITKTYNEFLKNLNEVLHFQFSDGEAHVINRNTASYATKFDWGIVTNSGDTIQSRGSGLYLFEKLSGDWKAIQVAGTHQYY